ncbi:hypothetical protein [Blastococcus sp. Marseille-P5729]|uniref:hypothetical protein n=1 Tax=Blastococcus sp. Marseille-P5729 TaxID=2086582 RepID=UPI000D10B533|nr:hypothetical protein [Blastococcus sp. Marseille-P5729]
MAGIGVKILAGVMAIPLQKFVTSKLESSWRSATGTEPPSKERRKEQEKANKEAEKLGLLPRPIDEPKLADALMWSALTAMSIIAVKYATERGAQEMHRIFVGTNPPPGTVLSRSTEVVERNTRKTKRAV